MYIGPNGEEKLKDPAILQIFKALVAQPNQFELTHKLNLDRNGRRLILISDITDE
jgi:hypothetical protein